MQRGVTLVELLVGLAIATILLAMATPSFSVFLQNSRIRTAADAIQNGLSLARAEAVRRNTAVEFVRGTGSAWTVRCATAVPDSDDDGLPDCPGVNPEATTPSSIQARPAAEGSSDISVATSEVVAATGLAAAAPVFISTLTFNSLGRVTGLPAGHNAVFTVGGSCGTMRCLRVIATSGGQIRMCDPALPDTDPQGC